MTWRKHHVVCGPPMYSQGTLIEWMPTGALVAFHNSTHPEDPEAVSFSVALISYDRVARVFSQQWEAHEWAATQRRMFTEPWAGGV